MSRFFLGSLLAALIALLLVATPGEAHWADLAVAEIAVGETKAQITLVFPTGLVATADDDRDGRLSADEVRAHRGELQALLGERIRLTDGGRAGTLAVEAVDNPAPLKSPGVAPGSSPAIGNSTSMREPRPGNRTRRVSPPWLWIMPRTTPSINTPVSEVVSSATDDREYLAGAAL